MEDSRHHRQPQHGRGNLPVGHARGLRYDNLILPVGDVESRRRCDEQGDWHQQGDDLGGRQQARPQEGEHGRSVLDDRILDLAEALRKKGDQRKTADNRDESSQHVAKKIALKTVHSKTRGRRFPSEPIFRWKGHGGTVQC